MNRLSCPGAITISFDFDPPPEQEPEQKSNNAGCGGFPSQM